MNGLDFSVTFGICLSNMMNPRGGPAERQEYYDMLDKVVTSIEEQNIPNYEIIFVGDREMVDDAYLNHSVDFSSGYRFLDFDETLKPGWITKKKNMLAWSATKDYTVLIHDYVSFDRGWYDAWKNYSTYPKPDWLSETVGLGMNMVRTDTGHRSADWLISPYFMELVGEHAPEFYDILRAAAPHENHPKYVCGLPYDCHKLRRLQYISGAFIFGMTSFLKNNPQNEELLWGQAEDVDWSSAAISASSNHYFMNKDAGVTLLKPNKWKVTQMPPEAVKIITDWEYGRV